MASPTRTTVKTIPAKERERHLDGELADYQRGYMILETAIEVVLAKIVEKRDERLHFHPLKIHEMLSKALMEAGQQLSDGTHPANHVEKIFCDRCHTFLTDASEQAGYCIKCEGRD